MALVTGASSGIGATFARRLAAGGHNLILVARRKERLEELARELREKHDASAEVLAADLADEAGLEQVERRIEAAPDLALLVNNAGFGTIGFFSETDPDGQYRMHKLHVLATMRLTRAALPGMVARNHGGVINVSSVAGFWQSPYNVSYCSTKAWINSFTEGLHLELRSSGSAVRVQALCPGFTYSEFHDVVKIDRSIIAKSLWMQAETVVDDSLRGLQEGRLYVVPGWRYKILVFLLRWLPRGVRHAVALSAVMRHRRPKAQ